MSDDDDDAALEARLAKLDAALKAREEERLARETPTPVKQGGIGRAMSVGLNVFSEFVGAVVAGALIGWQADVWLGTKPWLLVVFLGLGVAAGFWNVFRLASRKPPPEGEE